MDPIPDAVEMGDLPLDLQMHVLRFLDWKGLASVSCASKTFHALGSLINRHPRWQSTMSFARPGGGRTGQDIIRGMVEELRGPTRPHVALVFVSGHWDRELKEMINALRDALPSATAMIGCLAAGIIGTTPEGRTVECEDEPAISLNLLHLPGALVHVFWHEQGGEGLGEAMAAVGPDGEGPAPHFFLVGDSSDAMMEANERIKADYPSSTKMGGLGGVGGSRSQMIVSSGGGGDAPLPPPLRRRGVAGLVVRGGVQLEAAVTRGVSKCGPPYVITDACRLMEHHCIHRVRPPGGDGGETNPLKALIDDSNGDVPSPLFVGVADGSDADHFSVHGVTMYDPEAGSIGIDGPATSGQAIAFHEIDSKASEAELTARLADVTESMRQMAMAEGAPGLAGMELAGEMCLSEEPVEQVAGAIGVICRGRGEGLHGKPDADTGVFRKCLPSSAVCGFFANGELGPKPANEAGGSNYSDSDLLGFTTVFGVWRIKYST